MSAHKNIDRICIVIVALTLLISVIFCSGQIWGIQAAERTMGYENCIFDSSKVHKVDIIMDNWDSFIENCESEEYSECSLVIDGEAIKNVGIRAKGNTSLSSVKNMDSSRYSFKVEFDHYENGKTYHGLDKICFNNIIQDNSYMKDFLAYTLMKDFGADAPLCSFADISVNGEERGLYLAVESVEEAFLQRNYGNQYGELYKPDSMSFGGGRGNGRDFDMPDFSEEESGFTKGERPDFTDRQSDSENAGMPEFEIPEDFNPENMPEKGGMQDFGGKMGGGPGGGMGSDDVKLKYTDDDINSYSNIFNNAKTDVNTADQERLIRSLKALLEQSDIESTVDTDEVIRYFVVHNFLVNGDSYTGQMIHNYYLYEKDGQLSMIPWDYNLAFGTFSGGNASSSVNSPIDTPVSGDMSDRPMISWIFDNEEYTEKYHQLFSEFLNSTDMASLISETAAMIDEYVKNDATKFCTYEEFQNGVDAIAKFCELRCESIRGQLEGTIPSTSEGQNEDSSSLIDTGKLNISDMGTMNMGGKGPGGNDRMNFETPGAVGMSDFQNAENFSLRNISEESDSSDTPGAGGFNPDNMPEGFDPSNMPGRGNFDPNNMPEGFDPSNMPGGERPSMGDFPDSSMNSGTNTAASAVLLAVSAVFLIAGLVFAAKFKR